jgi:hypothetical protein
MYSNKFDPTKPVVVSQPVSNNGGPRTEAGKEISSRNATRHGCCSTNAKLILPSENIEDFKALEAARFRSYEPKDATETDLIHQLVTAEWLLQRSVRTLVDIEAQIFAATPNPLQWDDQQHKTITRFQRYRTSNQNAVAKCRKAVEDYRKNRVAEAANAEKQVIQKERLAVYKEKNKPEPTIQELLDQIMAQKSERDRLKQQTQPEKL